MNFLPVACLLFFFSHDLPPIASRGDTLLSKIKRGPVVGRRALALRLPAMARDDFRPAPLPRQRPAHHTAPPPPPGRLITKQNWVPGSFVVAAYVAAVMTTIQFVTHRTLFW